MGDASLLALPAEEGAARYLRHLCKQADAACLRLAEPADPEALHDFRVAIRRSRSWLRAYHRYLPLDKPLHRRLRALARRTNAARDAEVSMEGLQALAGQLTAAQRVGMHWMLARLEQDRRQAYADILHHVPATWPGLVRDLRHRLRRHKVAARPLFSHATFALTAAAEAELAQRLTAIGGEQDIDAMHQARIAAKRLRYLLEPFRDEVQGVRETVQRLTALQDALGSMHDGHVLQQRLAESAEEAARLQIRHLLERTLANPESARRAVGRGPAEQAGLLALVGLAVVQQHRRFAEVQSRYLGEQLPPFLSEMEGSIARLTD
jgi:CHAD domain-containing protein